MKITLILTGLVALAAAQTASKGTPKGKGSPAKSAGGTAKGKFKPKPLDA
jgi:hypothetical protein